MPREVTVWAVRLHRDPRRDVKGVLELEADALVFAAEDGSGPRRIALTDVRKARRVIGSPVLLVEHADEGMVGRTAFYFAQPPPLEPAGRNTRRKMRRQGVTYLGASNRELKGRVKEWERAVREAAGAACG